MRTVRLRILSVLVLAAGLLVTVLPAAPAAASASSDYPEFPYPAATGYDEPYRGQFHFSRAAAG